MFSQSSYSALDPLSDVLALLKPQNYMSGGVDAGGDWCVHIEPEGGFQCFAIVSGQCWLRMDGTAEPLLMQAGDCCVLPHGLPFRLASDLALPPVDIMTVIQAPLYGRILTWNGGGSCMALSAFFNFSGDHSAMLLEGLPPVIHVRNEGDRAALRWYLERLRKVLADPQPGGYVLGQHLAQMMLIEALRLYMAETVAGRVGWLSALADRQVGAALTAMHEKPGQRWTLQQLAARVGMSRSVFAIRFKEKVGSSAMEYLTRWRMLRAADRLTHSDGSVAEIALSLGYESESAFGATFRRIMGSSPRQYSRAKRDRFSSRGSELQQPHQLDVAAD